MRETQNDKTTDEICWQRCTLAAAQERKGKNERGLRACRSKTETERHDEGKTKTIHSQEEGEGNQCFGNTQRKTGVHRSQGMTRPHVQ